jgi:hypothetical protein
MRKNRFMLITILAVLTCTLLLGACGGDALKGTWVGKRDSIGITFTFDGKGKCNTEDEYGIKDTGTYTIEGSNAKIKMSYWDSEIVYQFTIDGNKLSMVSDEPYRPSYELEKK